MRAVAKLLCLGLAAALAPAAARAAEPSVLARIKSEGVLRVCYHLGAPEVYKDPKTGEFLGVFVNLVNELARWMKVKVQPVEVNVSVAVLSLKRGDCDLEGGSLVYNAPRAMEVNYIRPFFAKGINAVIPKENAKGLRAPSDLDNPGITLAVQAGTREHEIAQRLFPKAKILALQLPVDIQAAQSVKRGDADAAILPSLLLKWWLAVPENAAWAAMAFPDRDFGNAPNGWTVRYGDPDWKSFLDAYSGWVAANGVAQQSYEQYMTKTNPFEK